MRGVMIFFGVLFITLLIGVVCLYFYFEKPKQEEINIQTSVVNFSIYATKDGEYVKTGYVIKVDGTDYSTGETLTEAPIVENIPTNRTVVIYNKNKEGQEYYTTVYQKQIVNNMEPQRVELKLITPGKLLLSHNTNLSGNSQIQVVVASTSNFNKPYLCFKWSTHIITVYTVYQEVKKLDRYELYDKCYNFDREITNESFALPINFKTFGNLDDNDFIKLAFIDSDCLDSSCSTFVKNDKNESVDIGATDIIYELKK